MSTLLAACICLHMQAVNEMLLQQIFEPFGTVTHSSVMLDGSTGAPPLLPCRAVPQAALCILPAITCPSCSCLHAFAIDHLSLPDCPPTRLTACLPLAQA